MWNRCRRGALLKSSGCLTGERCGGVAARPFSLSAAGRCLRQPRHTPLIILPVNKKLWLLAHMCLRSVGDCEYTPVCISSVKQDGVCLKMKRRMAEDFVCRAECCWSGSSGLTAATCSHFCFLMLLCFRVKFPEKESPTEKENKRTDGLELEMVWMC